MVLPAKNCRSGYPNVAKVEDATDPPVAGSPLRYDKAPKGEAVVGYAEPLATQEPWYPRLSRRVRNMDFFPLSGCHR